ncbi:hypothetical protein BDP81DRAFT_19357 [Colletotrichum phormii]|uniref:Uncharacterized protein n=1 Tax=Colletotrichum phormii TaxID=359342 RepID=A0AAJ0EM75_9PEZI|nr:uncharacterized protein BDP81DRAFT_19357 [Colletotrichum phormii]KAK1656297.1 hypothetical protein BDP81DRAFT_19357 [Colletotrichum phormii]
MDLLVIHRSRCCSHNQSRSRPKSECARLVDTKADWADFLVFPHPLRPNLRPLPCPCSQAHRLGTAHPGASPTTCPQPPDFLPLAQSQSSAPRPPQAVSLPLRASLPRLIGHWSIPQVRRAVPISHLPSPVVAAATAAPPSSGRTLSGPSSRHSVPIGTQCPICQLMPGRVSLGSWAGHVPLNLNEQTGCSWTGSRVAVDNQAA